MAHFEIRARSIHGTTQTLRPETSLMFDLWGPLYQGVPGGGYDVELVVDAQPVLSAVTITRGELSADSRRRTYVPRAGKSVGKVTVRAQDQRNSV